MICETILGIRTDPQFQGCREDPVQLEWDEAYKRLHKKTTLGGREIGIRLDHAVLTRGLWDGDVLALEGDTIITVELLPCQVIVAQAQPGHSGALVQAAYEIGNRHAPLFWGKDENQLIVVWDAPMEAMLQKIHGLVLHREIQKLDLSRRIRASAHGHSHT